MFKKIKAILLLLGMSLDVLGAKKVIDRVGLETYTVHSIIQPKSVEHLQKIVQSTDRPIAIAGARYSQGGQSVYPDACLIDMSKMNKIISFDAQNKKITVQAGITWRKIQKKIDPSDCSVKVMQSYNDFSVGGSLGVNVHARDLAYGSLINTVESFKIILADGSLVYADRQTNADIFHAAIGGYGLLGIIVEATLSLTDNVPLEKQSQSMNIGDYKSFFYDTIYKNKNAVFHSALLWPNDFAMVTAATFFRINDQVTEFARLQPLKPFYPKQMLGEQCLRRVPWSRKIRPLLEQKAKQQKQIVWRNYEMSYTVNELKPLAHFPSTTVLQEYFVPVDQLEKFVGKMRALVKQHNINMLNAAIRHVPADNSSLLSYARQESFALVLYINIWNTDQGKKHAKKWTQKLIDAALSVGGTYYLPYQIFATKEQFRQAYPQWDTFMMLKNKYDPTHKFNNMLFKSYA